MNTSGTPWNEQELQEPLVDVIVKFRAGVIASLLKNGAFDTKSTDHNSDDYAGLSNKQITIAAVKLDSSCKDKAFDVKREVMMRAAFGT